MKNERISTKATAKRDTMRQHKKARQQSKFITAFSRCGVVGHAASAAGIARTQHYRWLEEPEYVAAFEAAKEEAIEAMEHEARRRAITGTLKPVYHGGRKVGAIRQYSDTLLIFLMKAARPEVYRDRFQHELTGPGGDPVQIAQTRATVHAIMANPKALEAAMQLGEALDEYPPEQQNTPAVCQRDNDGAD